MDGYDQLASLRAQIILPLQSTFKCLYPFKKIVIFILPLAGLNSPYT